MHRTERRCICKGEIRIMCTTGEDDQVEWVSPD